MDKHKKLQEKKDLYIQFSDEEIEELGWANCQKLSVELTEDGGIQLKPFVSMELDMAEWPREILEFLIKESCDKDLSVNDIINDTLKQMIEQHDNTEN